MIISTQVRGTVSILKLSGELDASNSVQVDQELICLIENNPNHIWIDGTGISYISSAGLGVFLSHLSTLETRNINLIFFGLSAKIKNVFSILGLDLLVQIVESEADALAVSKMETLA